MRDYFPLGGSFPTLQAEGIEAQRRQQQAQQLLQAGLNPVQGGNQLLSMLAGVLSTVRGTSMQKDADAKISDVVRRQFEEQSKADEAKAMAERARRDEDYQRDIEKARLGEQFKAQYAQRNIDPNSPEGIAARLQFEKSKAGMQPQAPKAPPAFQQQIDALKAMGIELSPDDLKQVVAGIKPVPTPEQKQAEADPKAAAAQQAREILAQLEGNLGASGPLDQYMHPVDSQKFEKTVAQLVNPFQTLTRIPGQGAQSDRELATLMASFPATGNFDSTNKQQIENLRAYLDKLPAGQAAQGQQTPPPMGQQPAAPQGQPTATATGPNGQKIGLVNGQWVPI